jgi:uncharacterized protein
LTYPIPASALQQHIAILAKTGAGKTTTAKGVVEHVVSIDPGARVCILDSIKSDWWGLISSADGKKPGLPFNILGGPHGHVPLNASAGKAIGELVGSGALPLSIVDMADFEPGGVQKFFADFAPALMKAMRGVLYLVLEEAHEFAPKERAGFGGENMSVHYAKKLATAGRSKGIRLIVVTHRVQSLHNAVLGSCDTLIAQRLTAPADQEPVIKWLKANASKDVVEKVAASLSSLPTGTGWIVSGEAQLFERAQFPMIATFDNSKTPTADSSAPKSIATAKVDLDHLRKIVAEAGAKPIPPKGNAGGPGATAGAVAPTAEQLQSAEQRGYDRGYVDGNSAGGVSARTNLTKLRDATAQLLEQIDEAIFLTTGTAVPPRHVPAVKKLLAAEPAKPKTPPQSNASRLATATAHAPLTKSLARCLASIAWWKAIGIPEVSRARAAIVAGLSPTASTFGVYVSKLQQLGLVEAGQQPGCIRLTAAGDDLAEKPGAVDGADVVRMAKELLKPQAARAFGLVADAYPGSVARDDLADAMGLSRTASTLGVYLSESSKLGFIETAGAGRVKAAEWLFP